MRPMSVHSTCPTLPRRRARSLSSTCCAPTSRCRASTATRCWPAPLRSKTTASGSRASRGRSAMTSATVIAASLLGGERSAREVTEAALADIAAHDDDVHAFLLVMGDEALAQADAVDAAVARGSDPGPLAGVPVALKDNLCTKGISTTCGSRILEGWRPPFNATVIEGVSARLGPSGSARPTWTSSNGLRRRHPSGPTGHHRRRRVPGGSIGGLGDGVAAGFSPAPHWVRAPAGRPPAGSLVRGGRDGAHLRQVSRSAWSLDSSLDQIVPSPAAWTMTPSSSITQRP